MEPTTHHKAPLSPVGAPHATGRAVVTVRLVDNGGRRQHPLHAGTDSSKRHSFTILVQPENLLDPPIPFFNFATDTTCLRLDLLEQGCHCPVSGSAVDPCELAQDPAITTVTVREDAGWQKINNFMRKLS